jgi:hypothetical protein
MVNAINCNIPRNITIEIYITSTTNKKIKKKVVVNGISTQIGGFTINKYGTKGGHGEANKSNSIIY